MKSRTIWFIALVTGAALVAYLSLQTLYFREVLEICSEQFDLQAQRSMRRTAFLIDEGIKERPDYEDMTLDERIDGASIDKRLRQELQENGIDIPYHFRVLSVDGREIYRCSDYEPVGRSKEYSVEMFLRSPKAQMGVMKVHFPDRSAFIFETVHYMIPVGVLTFVILVMFIITMWMTFHQKRLSEIKNDFINNMTHELKTPISSISLAAQMLADTSMPKTEQTLSHLGQVIVDETRRLRFLVEKVLQMSMFDKPKVAALRLQEVDVNTLISDVVSTFRLKVENTGGELNSDLCDGEVCVMADEMHLTNVLFNLLDNAVKYREMSRPLMLNISTRALEDGLQICVSDNGIGLHRDDQKKVFEKFYRVSTGNRHDVKGFGLGLAYVKGVIDAHHGSIHAESTLGEGTRFIIKLPMVNRNN